MRLWPRLPLPRARTIAATYVGQSLESLEGIAWARSSDRLYAPTGGLPVDDTSLRAMRRSLQQLAVDAGYPHSRRRADTSDFDDAAVRYLAECSIGFGEAIRAETWAWVCVQLVPHVVAWRWMDAGGTIRLDRFAGSLLRNALGRLWYQGMLLDRGDAYADRWHYSELFGADQAVALLERPSLAASRQVCLAIGKVWSAIPQAKRKEDLFRETMKLLLVRSAVQRLDVMDPHELDQVISQCFDSMRRRLNLL